MIITCPACATRYELADGAIGAEGRTVRCANCRESWFEPGDAGADIDAEAPLAPAVIPQAPDEPATASPADAEPAPPAAPPIPAAVPAPAAAPVFERLPLVAPTPAETIAAPPPPATQTYTTNAYEGPSSFAYEPPFTPRRRRFGTWLLALLAFVLLLAAIAGALAWYGTPDWLPFGKSTFAEAKPGLVLDFPKDRVERKTLADGTEFFGARGTITNTGASRQSVPPLLIVLRDRQKREVYRWEVVPPKQQLGPGETMTINEAVTDIPRSATVPEIGWKAG